MFRYFQNFRTWQKLKPNSFLWEQIFFWYFESPELYFCPLSAIPPSHESRYGVSDELELQSIGLSVSLGISHLSKRISTLSPKSHQLDFQHFFRSECFVVSFPWLNLLAFKNIECASYSPSCRGFKSNWILF